jgi:NifU-like protein involved in Fe-S cluster formation
MSAAADPQELYPAAVLDHFFEPRGVGTLAPADGVVTARVGERRIGAELELSLAIGADRVESARFLAFGCPYLIAAASELVQRATGQTRAWLEAWTWQAQADRLGVPVERYGRLLMVEDALRACLRPHRQQI